MRERDNVREKGGRGARRGKMQVLVKEEGLEEGRCGLLSIGTAFALDMRIIKTVIKTGE